MILEIFVSLVRTKQSVIIYPNRKFGKFHKSHFFINDRHSAAPFHVWRIAIECGYMKRFFLYFLISLTVFNILQMFKLCQVAV
jgi:hypothetical protein